MRSVVAAMRHRTNPGGRASMRHSRRLTIICRAHRARQEDCVKPGVGTWTNEVCGRSPLSDAGSVVRSDHLQLLGAGSPSWRRCCSCPRGRQSSRLPRRSSVAVEQRERHGHRHARVSTFSLVRRSLVASGYCPRAPTYPLSCKSPGGAVRPGCRRSSRPHSCSSTCPQSKVAISTPPSSSGHRFMAVSEAVAA